MQGFKHYLTEAQSAGFAPWHARDPEEVKLALRVDPEHDNWGVLLYIGYAINKNGTVSVRNGDSSLLTPNGRGEIPEGYGFTVKYQTIKASNLELQDDKMINLWGYPDKITGSGVIKCTNLTSLDHLKTQITSNFRLNAPRLKEWGDSFVSCRTLEIWGLDSIGFKDFGKHFTADTLLVKEEAFNKMKNKGLLGLFKLKPTNTNQEHCNIGMYDDWFDPRKTDPGKAMLMIMRSEDLVDAQEALLDAGYDEYARL